MVPQGEVGNHSENQRIPIRSGPCREADMIAAKAFFQVTAGGPGAMHGLPRRSAAMKNEVGRELKVSELQPQTVVVLEKADVGMATLWVVEIGDIFVHFRAGAAGIDV